MPTFNLHFSKKKKPRNLISLPVDLKTLSSPITLTRESVIEEDHKTFKKRSQLVDYEEESYAELKREEQAPLVLTDSDNKTFNGMLMNYQFHNNKENLKDNYKNSFKADYKDDYKDDSHKGFKECLNNNYFIFINTGSSFKVIPVDKWYKFLQKNQTYNCTLEEAEKKIKTTNTRIVDIEDDFDQKRDEIDFVEEFDDDDGIDYVEVDDRETKKLSKAGKQINELIKRFSDKDGNNSKNKDFKNRDSKNSKNRDFNFKNKVYDNSKNKVFDNSKENINKIDISCDKNNGVLTCEELEKELSAPMTIKNLLGRIKEKFGIDKETRELITKFLKEKCEIKDLGEGKKVVFLRKE
ncbi:hypothetical protein DMUE_3025 [Dictyocoela muelleri]|nr:hypothetical protein DMUE_3025 [Dictyocoela muelleri]